MALPSLIFHKFMPQIITQFLQPTHFSSSTLMKSTGAGLCRLASWQVGCKFELKVLSLGRFGELGGMGSRDHLIRKQRTGCSMFTATFAFS